MKKFCLVPLLVVGFFIRYGNGQTGDLSDGKLAGTVSKLTRVAPADKGGKSVSEKRCGTKDEKSKVQPKFEKGSQLDPATEQMVEAAIKELSKQSERSIQDSVRKSIEEHIAQDPSITAVLSTIEGSMTTF
jgi:hypothetical protein